MTEEEEPDPILATLPEDYYLSSLQEFVPKTITIAYDCDFPGTKKVDFPFIKKEEKRTISGVRLSSDINFDDLEELDALTILRTKR